MSQRETYHKWLLLILLFVLAITLYRRFDYNGRLPNESSDHKQRLREFNENVRNNARLIYSKHARCRMDCRQIDESEVQDILKNGKVNKSKSELSLDNPRYALEGRTEDGQQVRIVFAKDKETLIVVTCIDLKKEWRCNCN